jgi:hypothetical protein
MEFCASFRRRLPKINKYMKLYQMWQIVDDTGNGLMLEGNVMDIKVLNLTGLKCELYLCTRKRKLFK